MPAVAGPLVKQLFLVSNLVGWLSIFSFVSFVSERSESTDSRTTDSLKESLCERRSTSWSVDLGDFGHFLLRFGGSEDII